MKVAWSYVALGNLIEANKYISSENPEAARKVINDIYEAGNKIKEFPEKGRSGDGGIEHGGSIWENGLCPDKGSY